MGYFSAIEKNKLLMYLAAQVTFRTLCWVRVVRHKDTHSTSIM